MIKNQVERETDRQRQQYRSLHSVFPGKIHRESVSVARDGQVGEIIKQLDLTYPGSFITLNNQLSHLQEDDTVEDVFEEGDVLTAVKLRHDVCRNLCSGCRHGDLVFLMNKDKQPIPLEPEMLQSWELRTEDFLSTIAVFRYN